MPILLVAWRLDGQGQFAVGDAVAVVLDDEAADAAGDQLELDLAGAGVQRVVHQFAHDGGRAFDDLAGGDLGDQFIGEFADRAPARGGGGVECGRGVRRRGEGVVHGGDCRRWRGSGADHCRSEGLTPFGGPHRISESVNLAFRHRLTWNRPP